MKLVKGFNDTFTLLAFRWQSINNRILKIALIAAFIFGMFFLYIAATTGNLLMNIVSIDNEYVSQTTKDLAIAYLDAFNTNELALFVSGVLGATLAMVFITPFSGYSLGGIVPSRDMSTIKSNDNYKLSDSIIVQMLSSLSMLQLFSLTLLSSLLTIEGGTGLGVLWGWFTWIALVFFTAAFMWCIEYINRRFGHKIKVGIILALIALVAVAIIVDPYHGTTFFGLSPIYVDVVKNIGTTYNILQILLSALFLFSLIIIFSLVINFVGAKTLTFSEPVMFKKNTSGKISWLTTKEKLTEIRMLFLLIFRYKVVWRPILITSLMAAAFILILGGGDNLVISSFIIVTPLVVSMSFGVNAFGVLGASNIWLHSQPRWRKTILNNLAILQITIIGSSYVLLFVPALLINKITILDVLATIPAMIVIAITFTMFGIWKSLKHPVKYVPSSRGDAILPPITVLSYMFQLIIIGGVCGMLVYGVLTPVGQWLSVGAILFVAGIFYKRYSNKWIYEEEYLNNVIKVTTTD